MENSEIVEIVNGKKFKLIEQIGCVGCYFDDKDVCQFPTQLRCNCYKIPTSIYKPVPENDQPK